MPSNYAQFDVKKDNGDGTTTPVPNTTVKVYDATNGVSLPDLSTNSSGIIAAGSLNVAVGTRIRFRIENYQGLAGVLEQITT